MLLSIDLLGLAEKDLEWYQMLARCTIVFIMALVFIRISGMRTFGTKSAFDVIVSITLGGMLGRCIMGHYPFFASLIASAGLILLHRLASFIVSRSKQMGRLIEGEAVLVFGNGRRQERTLKKYNINEQELLTAIHEDNLEDFGNVKYIWLEPDGKLSVIKKQSA